MTRPTLDPALFELFREEVRAHTGTLSAGLLDLEADPTDPARIEPLMRAAHSIKGACRIANLDSGVRLAHVMEDALVAAQDGKVRLTPTDVDYLLKGTDLLATLVDLGPGGATAWDAANAPIVEQLEPIFTAMAKGASVSLVSEKMDAGRITLAHVDITPSPSSLPPGDFPPVPPFTHVVVPANPLPLSDGHSTLALFREELRAGLLVASDPENAVEALKTIRGAAKLVKCGPVVRLTAALGGFFAGVKDGKRPFTPAAGEWVNYAISTLAGGISTDDETFAEWVKSAMPALEDAAEKFEAVPVSDSHLPRVGDERVEVPDVAESRPTPLPAVVSNTPTVPVVEVPPPPPPPPPPTEDAVVRVSAQSLNRLMGLAGESLVQARWLPSFSAELLTLRKSHDRLAQMLDAAFHAVAVGASQESLGLVLSDARRQAHDCRNELMERAAGFDDHAARNEDLNARLYREVIVSRMRPFGDGARGLPRLVRDMARSLGKEARLVIEGEGTEVDRDIQEKLESPLSHLVRNSVDHGIESPEVREAAGKPSSGTVRVEARHRAGMLHVSVSDDGGGVNLNRLRAKVIDRKLSPADVVARMTETELLEFLFLPGFSTAGGVTEFSGRGVGLDVVQDTIRKVGGSVRVTTQPGRGTTFHLQLPLTLSVIRAVVVDVAGEAYAFPHTRIDRLTRVPRAEVRSVEDRQFVTVDGQNVGLVVAAQLLDLPAPPSGEDALAVVLLSDASGTYGLVVDRFRGEQDLVVRPLDPRLGKVPNLSAAALLDDGSPVLIVDAEDLVRSMDQFIQTGSLARCDTQPTSTTRKKRVLVVDDSITVREVERQLLLHKGYDVTVAVDGMDGWNKVRSEPFDLLVSDIDMPRMTGLQLVAAVRGEERLRDLPVVIVSYKEREEDRLRGLEAGANSYLTKSAFHDNSFIETVEDLIGPAV
jgi:two-component system sensor histidine kinase and response regulator WspE